MATILEFPVQHGRASSRSRSTLKGRQSSAVTSPSVSAFKAAAKGAESHVLRFRMRLMVERSQETPRARTREAIASSSKPRSDMKSASCMRSNVYQMHNNVNTLCASAALENSRPAVHDTHTMSAKRKLKASPKQLWRPSNLRAWREFAGKTLEGVAAKMGMSHSQLSRVERGDQPYNQHILEIAALEYQCAVSDLLDRLPPAAEEPRRATRRG